MLRALTRLSEKRIERSPFFHSDNVTEVDKRTAAANLEIRLISHNMLKVFANVKLQATGMTERCWPPRCAQGIEMSKRKILICHHEISTSSKVMFEECASKLLTTFSQCKMKTNLVLESAQGHWRCRSIRFGTSLRFSS